MRGVEDNVGLWRPSVDRKEGSFHTAHVRDRIASIEALAALKPTESLGRSGR